MQKRFLLFLFPFFLGVIFNSALYAQSDTLVYGYDANDTTRTVIPDDLRMNFIKINLLALPLRTITLQYERVIKKYLSVALAVRYMPNGTVPYKNFIYRRFGDDDPEFEDILNNMKISNYAFTPEVRFYVGKKGFGQGFYIAPSYRFAHFTLSNIEYFFEDDTDEEIIVNMSGTMTANYGGFLLGAQWLLGKHLSLDWWIFAPFIGGEKTNLSGNSSVTMSEENQQILKENLEDLDIPYTNTDVEVYANGASLKLNGLVAGIGAGLAFGVRF